MKKKGDSFLSSSSSLLNIGFVTETFVKPFRPSPPPQAKAAAAAAAAALMEITKHTHTHACIHIVHDILSHDPFSSPPPILNRSSSSSSSSSSSFKREDSC